VFQIEDIRVATHENSNYTKHPKKDCENAIKSLEPANIVQHLGGATPIPTGYETTWLSGVLEGHSDIAEDPHAHLSTEHGAATHLAFNSGNSTSPLETKLQKLPKASNSSSNHRP
jgi:hypothetical protein